jgi:hypothetical protein
MFFVATSMLLAQQPNQQGPMRNQMNMQQNDMPTGMQMGMPCSAGYHGMMGKGMMMNPITDSQAKEIFTNYIKNNNLKGYSIVSIKKFNSFRGPKYHAEIKDSSGNLFTLVLHHGKIVIGPFPTSEIK